MMIFTNGRYGQREEEEIVRKMQEFGKMPRGGALIYN
jgi:hypothetical protein